MPHASTPGAGTFGRIRRATAGRFFFAALLALGVSCAAFAQAPQPQPAAPQNQAQTSRPLRVYIRAGLKTHAVGEHDYPQFLADWSKILTERGATVDGSLHFPTPTELENIDVMVTYKGDAGGLTSLPPEIERATLDAFLKRGGGLIALHDTICAADPEWFCSIYGGAKKHGQINFTLAAPVAYTITDKSHPIMQGMTDFTITDESFFLMTWAKGPGVHVLATAPQAATPSAGTHAGEVVPQIWTYERTMAGGSAPFRAFVWMQGHNYANITHEQVQPMLLRAIAWAGKAPIDSLLTVKPARGGRRGGLPPGVPIVPGATVPAPAPATK